MNAFARFFYRGTICALLAGWATSSHAEEQRCRDLGVNCTCSVPLNTKTYTATTSYQPTFYDPADSAPATIFVDFDPDEKKLTFGTQPAPKPVKH